MKKFVFVVTMLTMVGCAALTPEQKVLLSEFRQSNISIEREIALLADKVSNGTLSIGEAAEQWRGLSARKDEIANKISELEQQGIPWYYTFGTGVLTVLSLVVGNVAGLKKYKAPFSILVNAVDKWADKHNALSYVAGNTGDRELIDVLDNTDIKAIIAKLATEGNVKPQLDALVDKALAEKHKPSTISH